MCTFLLQNSALWDIFYALWDLWDGPTDFKDNFPIHTPLNRPPPLATSTLTPYHTCYIHKPLISKSSHLQYLWYMLKILSYNMHVSIMFGCDWKLKSWTNCILIWSSVLNSESVHQLWLWYTIQSSTTGLVAEVAIHMAIWWFSHLKKGIVFFQIIEFIVSNNYLQLWLFCYISAHTMLKTKHGDMSVL